jgi:hypothetical protein
MLPPGKLPFEIMQKDAGARPNVPGCFSPKLVKLTAIARLNREYLRATLD